MFRHGARKLFVTICKLLVTKSDQLARLSATLELTITPIQQVQFSTMYSSTVQYMGV